MKPKHERLRPLLDEVLPGDADSGGPNCAEVLGMVREERAKRGRRQVMVAAVAVMGLVVLTMLQMNRQVTEPVAAVVASTPKQVPLPPVQRINDDELLALLNDSGTPSALMEWPNGERTLLIVERGRPQPVQ